MSRFEEAVRDHLAWLAAHGYAETTLAGRRHHLRALCDFLAQRDVTDPALVTPSLLDSYQRHLFHHKKSDGQPLSFRTQAQRLIPVKGLFAWLTRTGAIPFDPAASLTLPKTEHRLPEAVMSVDEVEAVLAVADTSTALGVRDRAILEVFYSSAIRRTELIKLRVADIDHARGTLFVRQGKGGRDRHVPIGERARHWTQRYCDETRPALARTVGEETLFLTVSGGPFASDVLSRMVTAYVRAGAPAKHGSCHLFRHTAATLMLDHGADVRYVAEMLGHQKLETTMTYTRVSLAKLREVHAATHPAEAVGRRVPAQR
ncbi:MAG: site-specific tyrosine recombinase XerC [Acidimicrobiales bacterium]